MDNPESVQDASETVPQLVTFICPEPLVYPKPERELPDPEPVQTVCPAQSQPEETVCTVQPQLPESEPKGIVLFDPESEQTKIEPG